MPRACQQLQAARLDELGVAQVIGENLQIINVQARTYPHHSVDRSVGEGGYSGWHNDRGYVKYMQDTKACHVVMMFYYHDVRPSPHSAHPHIDYYRRRRDHNPTGLR